MAVEEFEQSAEYSHPFLAPGQGNTYDRIALTYRRTTYRLGNRTLVAMGKIMRRRPRLVV